MDIKLLVAGSRGCTNYTMAAEMITAAKVNEWRKYENIVTEIVSGTANGGDKMGELYARQRNIAIKLFPAAWDIYGSRAGYIRNQQMAEYADVLIALWDGKSPGTKNMFTIFKGRKYVYNYVSGQWLRFAEGGSDA